MSSYNKATDFASKDALSTGDPLKIIRGTELDDEYEALETAVNSKADSASPTFTGTATFAGITVNGTLTLTNATLANLQVDTIAEKTPAAGVTIDGLLIKDSGIPEAAVTAHQAALTVTESQVSDLQGYLLPADVDDIPVDAATTAPISSNWAYDHENAADPHNVYPLAASSETISGSWTFSNNVSISSTTARNLTLESENTSSAQDCRIIFERALGAGIAVNNNNSVGEVLFRGHDGTAYIGNASIGVFVDGTVSTGVVPTEMVLKVMDDGGTLTNQLRLMPDNRVLFETGIRETVYALSGTTPAIDPANGTIQTWTLTGNSTPTESLADGESVLIKILDGTAYTITWPTMEWVGGSAPTLDTTNDTWVEMWQVGSTVYGALVGVTS